MIQIKDKAKASQLRRELAAELSKPKPDMVEIQRIRTEIYKAGGHVGANPKGGLNFKVQEWKKDAANQ